MKNFREYHDLHSRSWQSCLRSDPLPSLAQESLNQQLRHWPALRAHNTPHAQVLSRTLLDYCMTYNSQENNGAHCAVSICLNATYGWVHARDMRHDERFAVVFHYLLLKSVLVDSLDLGCGIFQIPNLVVWVWATMVHKACSRHQCWMMRVRVSNRLSRLCQWTVRGTLASTFFNREGGEIAISMHTYLHDKRVSYKNKVYISKSKHHNKPIACDCVFPCKAEESENAPARAQQTGPQRACVLRCI